MNLILLDTDSLDVRLPRADARSEHVLNVLQRSEGDSFDVGLADGRMGKARVEAILGEELQLSVRWTGESTPLYPLTVIFGMPRPQTARRLLREMTAMGVGRLLFSPTDRSDPGYARSSLWTSGECERHLRLGAEQAFNPRLPDLRLPVSLVAAVESLDFDADRIAMDNYEAPEPLSSWMPSHRSAVIAFGAERGWSARERDLLRDHRFAFRHLGERVLRLETAAAATIGIILSRLGFL